MILPRNQFKKAWEWKNDLQSGATTSEKITEEYLSRIKQDSTNSYITVCADTALASARKFDKSPEHTQPLAGIPVALKDILLTKGVRTTCGSKVLDNYIPPYSGTVVNRLVEAGTVCLGKLNMDEFAMGSSGENSAYGPTLLPQNPKCVPGGSSSGSAAAIAGNLAVVTMGTDTGGSVRQPASFCGVVGLKPTYGRVSRFGVIAFASSLDQVGPVTLDVQDCADSLSVISGFDPWDSTSSQKSVENFGTAVENIRRSKSERTTFAKKLKVGVPKEFFTSGLDSSVKAKVDEALEALQRSGAELVPVSLPNSQYSLAVYYVVAVSEASANLARYDGVRFGERILKNGENTTLEEMYEFTRGELFGREVKRRILLGTFTLSAGYYDAYFKKACQVRNLICRDFQKAFSQCDFLLGPTTPTVAFESRSNSKDPLTMYLNDIYTVPVNLAGLPAISVPWGFAHGLPVGIQLIGRAFSEKIILQGAALLETLYDEQGGQ